MAEPIQNGAIHADTGARAECPWERSATICRWRRKNLPLEKLYGKVGVSDTLSAKAARGTHRKLKQVVADLSPNRTILQEALRKKVKAAQCRTVAAWAREAYGVSERRARRALPVHRSIRCYPAAGPRASLCVDVKGLAAVHLG